MSEIFGTVNDDTDLRGTSGADTVYGGPTIINGSGNDTIRGLDGDDIIYGGIGDDFINGGNDNDTVFGGDGNDFIGGFAGTNSAYGGNGNDIVAGGQGASMGYGGEGDDYMYLAVGQSAFGDGGNDTGDISFQGLTGPGAANVNFAASDISGDDSIIYLDGVASATFVDVENFKITGGDGDDTLIGGAGNDYFVGFGGEDHLEGSDGNDTLIGQAGFDQLYGGAGDDLLGDLNGFFNGGPGNDTAAFGTFLSALRHLSFHAPDQPGETADVILDYGILLARVKNVENYNIIWGGVSEIFTGDGNDEITAGGIVSAGRGINTVAGNGTLYVGEVPTLGRYGQGEGVVADTHTGRAVGPGVDTTFTAADGLGFRNLIGTDDQDTLRGDFRANVLKGAGGFDVLTGRGGADVFDFDSIWDSRSGAAGGPGTSDRITDFQQGLDHIDLADIDAVAGVLALAAVVDADDPFSFIGRTAYSGAAGELRWFWKGNDTFIQGDVDGDSTSDFSIVLTGKLTLNAGDFVL